MPTVPLRKAKAGADSFGHSWPEDGAVVEVDYDHAMTLLGIPDGGFTVADPDTNEPDPDAAVTEPDTIPDLDEVAPDSEPDASPAPAKRATRRTTKA